VNLYPQRLNLGGIPSLSSRHLHGLVKEDSPPPNLVSLILSNTAIDDDAAAFISACTNLESLELANTRITNLGVYAIIDACPELVNLDLTSCRGIHVTDRRQIFEAWQRARRDDGPNEGSSSEDDEPSAKRRRRTRSARK